MFLKLKDAGWYCIPIIQKTKKPPLALDHLGGFTGISYDGIPEEVLEEWDQKYPIGKNFGVALVLGKINNVCAVDIDSSDFKITELIPDTPLIKKGDRTRVGTYFYQHCPDLSPKLNFGSTADNDSVDFLNGHNITVLPPTMHKSGEPYIWIGEATALMKVQASELSILDKSHLQSIDYHYKNKFKDTYSLVFGGERSRKVELNGSFPSTLDGNKERCAHGSQDRIKTKASELLFSRDSLDQVVKELVAYDKSHHTGVSYFEDVTRGKDSNSGEIYTNAVGFVSSLLRTINVQRKREKKEPLVFFKDEAKKETSIEASRKETLKKPQLPLITGMMKIFVDYLNNASTSENTEVYLGASLAWLSMLTASRCAVKTKAHTTPANLMLWGIMPSGVGKDSPQSLLQHLFFGHRILGASNYKSAPALIMKLNNVFKKAAKGGGQELVRKGQRENLILIDECSSLFRMMAGGENYQQDMVEMLNTLYSRSSSFYAGDQSVLRGADYGAAYNPYFTLMGFTTNNHFKNILGTRIVGNGFFERSLIFLKQTKAPFNLNQYKDVDAFNELKSFTDHCLREPVEFVTHGLDISPEREIVTEINYKPFPINQEAEDFLFEYRKNMYEKESNDFDESFNNRFAEIVTKLSMLHALSEQASFISIDNVRWAQSLVEWSYSNAKPYLKNMKEQDPYQKAVEKISTFITKTPEKMISREELLVKLRFEPKGQKRALFLNELIELGFFKVETVGRKNFITLSSLHDTVN